MQDDDLLADDTIYGDYFFKKLEETQEIIIFDPVYYMQKLDHEEPKDLAAEIVEGWGSDAYGVEGDTEVFMKILSHNMWRSVSKAEVDTIGMLYNEMF